MTPPPDTAEESQRLDALYRAKARSEIGLAEASAASKDGVRGQGDVLAEVLLVKGAPGADDRRTRRALSGEDGTAIGKALDALGLPKPRYAFCTSAEGPREALLQRVRLLTEAIDPSFVVLLDPVAASDFTQAFRAPTLALGVVETVGGRTTVAIEGLEASLGDEAAKRRVWRQLQALAITGANETDAP